MAAKPARAAALLAAILLVACTSREPGRVLIVGLDGASPRLVEPMMAAGRLPNLARLARDGAYGHIRSDVPIQSPRIWNTVATGVRPERHGILDFAHPDAAGQPVLYLSTDRQVPALWNIFDAAGASVGIVTWWNTYPPPRVRGTIVSDHVFPASVAARRELGMVAPPPSGPVVFPQGWAPDPSEEAPLPQPPSAAASLPDWLNVELLADVARRDVARARMLAQIERESAPDLAMVLFTSIDRASHVLWVGVDPGAPYPEALRLRAEEAAAARALLEATYEFNDALLGHVLASYGPEDLVIVLSDHGFEPGVSLGVLTGVHRGGAALEGVVFAAGAGIVPGCPVRNLSVADVAPTVLAWRGLPVAEDMDGHVAEFLGDVHPETIATYSRIPIERLPLEPSGHEEEVLEELRALGYIE
jgi:predicted AlkP superfamily phosphohydrolase/phosphomutase